MMNQFISVIIPVFNQERHLLSGIDSLKQQTIGFDHLQVILINDGSTDRSMEICQQLADQYKNIIFVNQENKGVSAARNAGIRKADGKYIFFLDADDCLEKDTIRSVTLFFDSIEEDVDLVTYPIETHYDGTVLAPHFRYRVLKESGVYSLRQYAYIGQTTMNIAVRNHFEKNILFDEEQTFSEDQSYCCNVLKKSLKMGYCKDGKYIYNRSHNTSSGTLAGACFIFEQCMYFFEQLFSEYEEVPLTFQGLYVNDVYWKLCSNILFPWHYNEKEYRKAVTRIVALLDQCRDDVILKHPNMDFFEKYYLISLKRNNRIQYLVNNESFELYDGSTLVLKQNSVEIVVTRLYLDGKTLHLEGFLKTVFFLFYEKKVILYAIENGENRRELALADSSHNYYLSHESTQAFQAFQYAGNLDYLTNLTFLMKLGRIEYPVTYYFMPLVSLSHKNHLYQCKKGNHNIIVKHNSMFCFSKQVASSEQNIWLYYDCVDVEKDNGRIQFEHDFKIKDEVERYYIVTNQKQINPELPSTCYVSFGSPDHIELLKKCSKILTAYIEESNLFPYDSNRLDIESNQFDFEVVYLQHGVLHLIMPWKYSREKMAADRIVISTEEEKTLYEKNGYHESQLIRTGMPRLDLLKKKSEQKRILYAPSWRRYLVGDYSNHHWLPLKERFVSSQFYEETSSFLKSDTLKKMLEQYGYTLDVKLHPIFQMYQDEYVLSSERIQFADGSVEDGQYALMITDFSSYAYNFHFLNIPVLYFIPDEEQFKCGMNGYRELLDSASIWESAARNSNEILEQVKKWLGEKYISKKEYHFYTCSDRCQTIYQTIKGDKN